LRLYRIYVSLFLVFCIFCDSLKFFK